MNSHQRTDASQCVKEALNHGNIEFVEALRREQLLLEATHGEFNNRCCSQTAVINRLGRLGEIPQQRPKAAVLACSDARVPVLELFQQTPNELFEIQLEGNVASAECLGSLSYAVEHLPTVEGIVVLGHTGCGAVTAAVEHYLSSKSAGASIECSLMSLINAILPSVDIAASILDLNANSERDRFLGVSLDRHKLIEITSFVNAAAMAWKVQAFVRGLKRSVPVWYGVYDLASCRILHADLVRRDGSLLFGLGDAPHVTELNDVAQSLVQYLQKMTSYDAAKFASNGHNGTTTAAWETLSTGDTSSST